MIAIAVAVLLVINAAVSIAVWRSGLYEPPQKRLQYLLIWLIPLVGAAASWVVLREHSRPTTRDDSDGIKGNPYSPWNDTSGSEGHDSHHHGGDGGH